MKKIIKRILGITPTIMDAESAGDAMSNAIDDVLRADSEKPNDYELTPGWGRGLGNWECPECGKTKTHFVKVRNPDGHELIPHWSCGHGVVE